jgi:hypothetical protein
MSAIERANNWLALRITNIVSTMWCAYAFTALAFVSLPDAIKGGTAALVSWIAQTFLQLVLLSIIMVGQKVQAEQAQALADSHADLHNKIDAMADAQ